MEIKPEVRFLNDVKGVLCDKAWAKTAPNFELYYMYRGIKKKNGLRYDVTIIPSRMLGKEFVKTKGNLNSGNFPELYTTLEGKAFFIMQRVGGKIKKDVIVAQMKKGEWIVIPAGYYIVAINPSKKILKLGNWVASKNKNIYREMEEKQGACYYYTRAGWIKNKNYGPVPNLRFEKPLKKMPKNLDFLYGKSNGLKKTTDKRGA